MAVINFPDPTENNPNTGNPYSDGWYNSGNGVTYQYVNGTWVTATITTPFEDIFVDEDGDTMTGALTLHADPASPLEAATKQYVDNEINSSEGGETGRLDGRYLIKNDSSALNQTVASTGTTTFDGLVEAGSGVSVTSGAINLLSNGEGEFSNSIVTGDYETGTTGARAFATGYVQIRDDAGTGSYECYQGGTSSNFRTVRINTSGNAFFSNSLAVIDAPSNYQTVAVNGVITRTDTSTSEVYSTRPEIINAAKNVILYQSRPSINNSVDLTAIAHFRADPNEASANTGKITNHYGFEATTNLSNIGTTNYGFFSNLSSGPGTNYNFYAAGSAPNFFADRVILSPGWPDSIEYFTVAGPGMKIGKGADGDKNALIELQNAKTNANVDIVGILFTRNNINDDKDIAISGSIKILGDIDDPGISIDAGSGGVAYMMDERKISFTDFSQTASSTILQLEPKVEGFSASKLQQHVARAVTGVENEEEAIGTLTDYNGTVLETNVPEPEELEYTEETTDDEGVTTQAIRTRTWTATGTRPVYQGVDQTKLIPLLTKALQEALSEIGTLKDRLDILEGN